MLIGSAPDACVTNGPLNDQHHLHRPRAAGRPQPAGFLRRADYALYTPPQSPRLHLDTDERGQTGRLTAPRSDGGNRDPRLLRTPFSESNLVDGARWLKPRATEGLIPSGSAPGREPCWISSSHGDSPLVIGVSVKLLAVGIDHWRPLPPVAAGGLDRERSRHVLAVSYASGDGDVRPVAAIDAARHPEASDSGTSPADFHCDAGDRGTLPSRVWMDAVQGENGICWSQCSTGR
jgi:hypothetical protein